MLSTQIAGFPRQPAKPPAAPLQPAAPDRASPAAPEAEEHVLSCCLIEGSDTFTKAVEQGVTDQSFFSPANRAIWAAIRRLGDQANLATLVQELKSGGLLEAVGGVGLLMELERSAGTTTRANYFITKLREAEIKRDLIRQSTNLIEHAYNGSSVEELTSLATDLVPVHRAHGPSLLKTRRVTVAKPPSEPVTRLFLAGKPIATPGNIQSLISKAKTGKTAATGGAVAAIIAARYDRHGLDTLGFTAPHTTEAVVLIDTEQSPFDAYTCHRRAMVRAQQEEDPDWLHHYALVGYTAEQCKESFVAALDQAVKTHGGIFMAILDGVADFVNSVNDEAECNQFVTWLRALSVQYNCPVLCVIHSNEAQKSGDDGRGHLGKQLTRKAESNLLLKKDGDITTITSEKQRKAPITDADGVAFRWSDEVGRHVSCGVEVRESSKPGRRSSHSLNKFLVVFPRSPEKHLQLGVLHKAASQISEIPRNTFRDLCEREFENGQLERIFDKHVGLCYRLMVP